MPEFDKNFQLRNDNYSPSDVKLKAPRQLSPDINFDPLSSNNSKGENVFDLLGQFSAASEFGPRQKGFNAKEMEENLKRYPIYNPTIEDYENYAALGQSTLEKGFRGVTKGVNLAATTVVGGFGTLYGLGKWAVGGHFSDIWNNEIMQSIDEWNKKVDEEYLPNYYSNREKNAKWYEADNWLTANFLFDKLIKNSGFAVGAMISGNIANAGLMAVGGRIGQAASYLDRAAKAKKGFESFSKILQPTSRAFSQGKNVEAAMILEKELTGIADLSSKAKALKDLAAQTNKFSSVSNGFRRTAVAAYSSAGEANFEAVQTSNEYRERLIEDYVTANGQMPTGADLEDIDRRANNLGLTSFVGNVGLLGVTEWFQLPYLIGSTYRTTKAAHSRLVRETGEIVFDGAGKASVKQAKTAFGRMYQGAKRDIKGMSMPGWTKYVLDPKEGVQEFSQFALQVGAQNYYDKAHETGAADFFIDGVYHGFFGKDEHGEGVGAFTSKEGIEGGIIGMITGGVMQGRQRYRQAKEIKSNTAEFVEALNNAPTFREAFKEKLKSANRGVVLQEMQEEAIKEGNVLEAKDLQHDLMFNYVYNKIKYGRKDMIKNDLNELLEDASTEEGLSALVEQGLANKEDTIDSFRKRTSNFLNYVNELEKIAENVEQVYGGATFTDKDGNVKPAYSEAVLEKLTYAAAKITDYDVRLPQLEGELMAKGMIDVTALNEVANDPVALQEAELEQLIKIEDAIAKEEILPTEGQELVEKLKDYLELKQRKGYYFKEYNDIISNPAKYEEIDRNVTIPDEKPITVTTKKGEKEVVLGREYLLGTVIKHDKDGNEVYRAPKLTIVEQKEDGSLVVKDSKGKVFDVTAEQLEDYDLIDPQELQKNKTANWFINHWNELFVHKSIKHKKGKKKGQPIKGRVQLSKDHNSLFFVWKDDSGKIKRLKLEKRHFIPNKAKGYTTPVFEKVGELTPVQRRAVEEMVTQEEVPEPLTEKQDKRAKLISDLFDSFSKKHDKSQKLIKSKQEQLEKVREELSALRKKIAEAKGDKRVRNSFRFKSETRKALQRAISLTNTERQLQREIANLEEQAADIELVQIELMDMLDSLESYPENTKEFMETLQFDIELLKEAAQKNAEQISAVNQMIKSTKKAIQAALRSLENLITSFENKYPGIPIVVGKRFYDKNKDTVLREELDEVLDAIQFTEEEVIVPNEQRIKDLEEHLDIMYDEAAIIEKSAQTKQAILDEFQGVYDNYKLQKLEEAVFRNNDDIQKEMDETHDDDGVPNAISEEGVDSYEPASKKDKYSVVGGTKPFSGWKNPLTGQEEKPREHHERSNRFGFRFHGMRNKDKIKGVVVNSTTEGGLIDGLMVHLKGESEVDPTQTLALVMVMETPDGLKLVDEFGEVIKDKTDLLNKAVYQVFPALDKDGQLTAYYDGKRDTMFREQDEGNVEELTEKYAKWREAQLAKETRSVPEKINASFGIPQYNTYLDDKGREQRDYAERTTAHDAGLIDDNMLVSESVLTVATTNETVQHGSVTFNTPLGRVFLRIPGGLAKVQNRKHTASEAETIYSVLYQVAKQGKEDGTFKTERSKRLFNWLKSVAYWGIVKDAKGKAKDPGYSSIWFEHVKVGEDTVPKLMFSKNRQGVTFTPAALEANKNEILFILESMYVNVDASRVNKKSYNAPYYQIIGVNSKGDPVTKKWPNYQSYLLANKSPDSKGNLTQSRKKEDIPLTTQYKKVTPENPVNRQGIYFTRNSAPEQMHVEEKVKKTVAVPETPKSPTTEKAVDSTLPTVKKETDDDTTPTASPYTLDGVTENLFPLSVGENAFFTLDLAKAKELYAENPINFKNVADKLAFIKKLAGLQIFGFTSTEQAIKKMREANPNLKTDVQAHLKIAVEIFNDLSIEFQKAVRQVAPQENVPTAPVMDGKTSNTLDVEGVGSIFYTLDLEKANALLAKEPADALSKDKRHLFAIKLVQQGVVDITADPAMIAEAVKTSGKSQAFIIGKVAKAVLSVAEPQLVLSKIPSDEKVDNTPPPAPKNPFNPTNVSEEKRTEHANFVTKHFGKILKVTTKELDAAVIKGYEKKGVTKVTEYTVELENQTFKIIFPAGSISMDKVSATTAELSKTDKGYDIKTLVGIGKLLENRKPEQVEAPKKAPTSYADNIDYSQYADDTDEKAMREIIERETAEFKPENWEKVEAWLKTNFPNIPVYRVKNIIQSTNGKQSWGMLHKGAIYLYENAEAGTVYHEVFEAVWKMFTTPQERQKIIDEFRDRSGSYQDRFSGETIAYKEATAKQLKEELAEEFRDKVMFNKSPRRNKGKSWIERAFIDLINFFKKFFVGKDALNNTRKLFSKIESGHYAKYTPYSAQLSMAQVGIQAIDSVVGDETSEHREAIQNIPAQQQHDIMQHMTFHVLKKLVNSNESLFNLPAINKTAIYKELHDVIIGKVAGKIGFMTKEIANDPKNEARYAPEINNNKILINNIHQQWQNIVDKHEELLQSYEITFDENDDLEVTNIEKDKHDPYGDATKIDKYRKASYAVKFLMSSLPYTTEEGTLVKSSINGAQLIPADKLTIDLRNKLYDSVDIVEMFHRLGEMALNDPNYANLYSRLLGNAPEMYPSFDNLDERGWELMGGFWNLMKSQNPDVLAVFILPDSIQIGDSALAGAAKQAKKEMISSMITKIKKGSDYFDYNPKNGRYKSSKKIKSVKLDKSAPKTYTSFLSHFDINIDPTHLKTRLNDNQRESFYEAVDGILLSMQGIEDMVNISTRTLDIDGNLLRLGTVQAIIENPEFESTYYNINGERSQTFIGTNPLSIMYDTISKATSFSDLKDTAYNYLRTDSFAQGSVLMNKLFVLSGDGRRRKNTKQILKPVYIDGTVDQTKGKKKQSSKLTYRQRVLQEINLNLDGVYMNLVPGDASLEWAVRMHDAKDPFVTSEQVLEGDFQEIFKNYLLAEIELVRDKRIVHGRHDASQLRFFKAILASMDKRRYNSMMKKINSKAKKKDSALEIYEAFENDIKGAVKNFIQAETKDLEAMLDQFGVIQYTDDGINVPELNIEDKYGVDINSLRTTLKTVSVNYMIANIEMHKVLYSDPYQYSDELKRIKNFNSPRQPLVNVNAVIGKALHKIFNNGYSDKNDIGYTDMRRNHFRTITFDDVESHYDMPGYENEKTYDETDGAGIITLKAVRKYRILANNWNASNEKQYRYEIAWEKRDKGIKLTKREQKLLDEGNPAVASTFTSQKPIVSGGKLNDRNYNDVMLDKYALIPYSYRILKEINPDSNAVKLYDRMMQEDIDYVVFGSARKVGAEKTLPLYDKNGELTKEPFVVQEEIDNPALPQRLINVPFNIMSVQAEVPSKDSHKITRGSQITKLATLDYMQNGIPIDFMPDLNDDAKFIEWTKLKDKTSYKSSVKGATENLYTLIMRNQELLEATMELGYRTLLKEFGIKEVGNTYVLENKTKLAKTLKSEMLKREINDNVSAAFDAFKDGDIVIEATPAYQQIRHILYSIADSRVVSPKIKGGMKVQIPVSLLESKKIEKKMINGKEAYVSDTLKFYEDADGLRHCEIMVGRWFDSELSDEELLDSWYEKDDKGNRTTTLTAEGKKVLSGIGFRIPTQKQNSIDVFVIKQLLPREYGDNVVVPSKIAKKVGSDFDIDKLSIYLKNVLKGKDGKIKAVPYLSDENSTVEERYAKYLRGEVKEYKEIRKDVKKDSPEWNELQKDIDKSYEIFRDKVNKLKEENIVSLSQDLDNIKENIDSKKESSESIYNMGYDIFLQLPIGIQDAFKKKNDVLEAKVQSGQIERYEKTLEFRSFAQDWITDLKKGPFKVKFTNRKGAKVEQTVNSESIPTLEALIGNYDLFLTSVGFTIETIEEFSTKLEALKQGKKDYKDLKVLERSALDSSKSNLYKAFNEEFNKTLAEVFDLMSLEEFKSQSVDLQNNKQALENEYIESLEKLTSHPLNFENLIKPNSADQMKKLAKEINADLGRVEIDYSSPGNMISRRFMSGLRQAFVSGKYAIGIAAVNQTNHSLNQRTSIYVDLARLQKKGLISQEDKEWLGDGRLKFKNYNKITVDGRITATLSNIKNAAGQYISDIIGMFIDGYVDISAGPWIMEIGATPTTASTWLFLLKAGVPIDDVAYFMNQPIIRDYLQLLENSGYSWLFIDTYRDLIEEQYLGDVEVNVSEIPALASLKKSVNKPLKEMNDADKATQIFILNEFLKYSKIANHMFQVTQGSNFDTANFNDGFLVFKKTLQLENARNTIISSVDDILESSFLGNLYQTLLKVRDAMSTVLISDRKGDGVSAVGTRAVIENVLTPYVNVPDRTFLKFSKKAVSDLFDWFMQTERNLNGRNQILDVLTGDTSTANEIMEYKKEVVNSDSHPLKDNIILNSIQMEPGTAPGKADNLYIARKDNKAYDQNLVISAFRELREHLGVVKGGLYGKLVRLALLQSGLTHSRISFTSLLPFEDFIEVYKGPLGIINKAENLANFALLNVFQRNNWNNSDIVPFKKETMIPYQDQFTGKTKMFKPDTQKIDKRFKQAMERGVLPKIVNISMLSQEGQSDVIVYNWEEAPQVTDEDRANGIKTVKAKKAWMKKNGDRSYSKKALLQKVYYINDKQERVPLIDPVKGKGDKIYYNYVYKAINAWGDGTRAQELYDKKHPLDLNSTIGQQSVLDNGFIKVNEVEDSMVMDVYNSEYMDLQSKPKEIAFTAANQERIVNGEKTTTIRNAFDLEGMTKIKDRYYYIKQRGKLSVNEAGGAQAMVDSEALTTTEDNVNKYPIEVNGVTYYAAFPSTQDFFKGHLKKWVYDILDVTDQYLEDQKRKKIADPVPGAPTDTVTPAASPLVVNIYSTDNNGFQGLSNFSTDRPYTDNSGVKFATVEAAFQYAKTKFATGNNENVKKQLIASTTGAQAKALGRKVTGLNTKMWDTNSAAIMKQIIKDSFKQNPGQIPLLNKTGDAVLTHMGGTREDKWTTLFPQIMMEVRNELTLEFDSKINKPPGLPSIDRTNETC